MYVRNMNMIYRPPCNMGVMCVQAGCGYRCMWDIANHTSDCRLPSIIHSAVWLLCNRCAVISHFITNQGRYLILTLSYLP